MLPRAPHSSLRRSGAGKGRDTPSPTRAHSPVIGRCPCKWRQIFFAGVSSTARSTATHFCWYLQRNGTSSFQRYDFHINNNKSKFDGNFHGTSLWLLFTRLWHDKRTARIWRWTCRRTTLWIDSGRWDCTISAFSPFTNIWESGIIWVNECCAQHN